MPGGTATGLGAAVEASHETLAELKTYFIPYPIELLHKSNCDHVGRSHRTPGDGCDRSELLHDLRATQADYLRSSDLTRVSRA